jgi:GNAT superfamily N-acetyltransferase
VIIYPKGEQGIGVHIRQATRQDWDRISRFIIDNYGAQARYKLLPRWDWQFGKNPFRLDTGDDMPVWIAVDEAGRVCGQMAVQDGRLVASGKSYDAGWIVDVMITPAMRGCGLGHKIHAALIAQRDCVVTLTMAPATRRIAEKAGAITLGPTEQLIHVFGAHRANVADWLAGKLEFKFPHRPILQAGWILRPLSMVASAAINVIGVSQRLKSARSVMSDIVVKDVARLGPGVEHLWEQRRRNSNPIHDRSTQFLKWRFENVPDLKYSFIEAHRGGKICGYGVIRHPQAEELREGVIVEVFADRDNPAVLDALIDGALARLSTSSQWVQAAGSTEPYLKAFRRNGFFRRRTMHPTVVTKNPELVALFQDPKTVVQFSKADHDWDQIRPRHAFGRRAN